MLKTKKISRIITILFLIYLVISFTVNFAKAYKDTGLEKLYNYSTEELRKEYEEEYNEMSIKERQMEEMKPVQEVTDEELEAMLQKNTRIIGLVVLASVLFETFTKNIMVIIIFIVVKVVNRRVRKEKLNKDDFYKSKQYYREILEQKRNM